MGGIRRIGARHLCRLLLPRARNFLSAEAAARPHPGRNFARFPRRLGPDFFRHEFRARLELAGISVLAARFKLREGGKLKRKAVITGTAGYLGAQLAEYLERGGWDVARIPGRQDFAALAQAALRPGSAPDLVVHAGFHVDF